MKRQHEEAEASDEEQGITPDQQTVLDLARRGVSFCFTGAAGTGKSYLIDKVQSTLGRSNVYVVAPTGLAAANVQGTTIHSWSGYGIQDIDVNERCKKIYKNPMALRRWVTCKTLIVDEVSMLSVEMFEDLSVIGKFIRANPSPFGGIQVILCGDFFQLPPVSKTEEQVRFCFQSPLWDKLIFKTIELKKNFRQESGDFLSALNFIRLGEVPDQSFDILQQRFVHDFTPLVKDGVEPTKLFAVNETVDSYNESRLQELLRETKQEKRVFTADDYKPEKLHSLLIPQRVELCVGVQVMLLFNLGGGLYNGLLGRVVDFDAVGGFPRVKFVDVGGPVSILPIKIDVFERKDVVASRRQLPLRLGYAMSIHKSQGMTIPLLDVDLSRVFTYGQVYVALSRASNLEGLRIKGFDRKKIKAHEAVKDFYLSTLHKITIPPPLVKEEGLIISLVD